MRLQLPEHGLTWFHKHCSCLSQRVKNGLSIHTPHPQDPTTCPPATLHITFQPTHPSMHQHTPPLTLRLMSMLRMKMYSAGRCIWLLLCCSNSLMVMSVP